MLHLTTVDKTTYNLLQEIIKTSFIKNNFALACGTSLALQIGHRTSVDLDFFCPYEFNVKELEIILETSQVYQFQYTENNSRILFGFINQIKCDFIHDPARLLEPFKTMDGVNYYSIADIAAMKLHTVCGRGKKKDFFDVYVLLKKYSWRTLLQWFIQKYDAHQLYILSRSILYFEDAENDPDIQGHSPYNQNWIEIKKCITDTCK